MKTKVMALISNMNAGGAQRVLLNQAKLFQNNDQIEFTIFSYEKPTGSVYDKEIEEEHLNVIYLNKDRHFFKLKHLGDFLNFFVVNFNWMAAIRKYKPDVVHTHVTEILRKCMFAIIICRIPYRFSTLHSNPLRYKGLSLFFAKIAFNNFGFIPICITKEQAILAMKYYHIKKYALIRNGVNFKYIDSMKMDRSAARKDLLINDNAFVVSTVGRLEAIKNISKLLDIFAYILTKRPDAILLIAGDGEDRYKLENKAKNLNIFGKIRFLGNVKNVITIYCATDIFCMPSISEASPMALHEAQYCGVRCVISDGIPKENVFTNNVFSIKQMATIDEWGSAILNNDSNIIPYSTADDFDINVSKNKLISLYISKYHS